MQASVLKKSTSGLKLSLRAIADMLPLALATVPWGMLCGALSMDAGLTPLQAQAMSLFVFAGAAQLSAVIMMGAGVGALSNIGSTFVISSRHILYSFDLRTKIYELPLRWRVPLAFLLTDEMYVVVKKYMKTNEFSPLYALMAGLTLYVPWNISTFVGIVMADKMNNLNSLGFDFAIVAVFVAMSTSEMREFPMLATTLVSATIAIFLKDSMPDLYIIVATIIGMLAGYLASNKKRLHD